MDNEEIYLNTLSGSYFPNLDKFFSFLIENDLQGTNLTAGAYFGKIVSALLRMNSDKLLTYIYSRCEIISVLIRKAKDDCFREVLEKFLNFQKNDHNTNFECKFLKHRFLLYQKILGKISSSGITDFDGLPYIFRKMIEEEDEVVDSEYFLERLFQDY